MSSTTRRLVQVALVVTMLAGCTTTGTIDGRVAVPDKQAAAVAFTYTASQGRNGGTLSTTLPSGEGFSGQYVQITSTSTVDTSDPFFWHPDWADWNPFSTPWFDGSDVSTSVKQYSGKVVATLFGDKGDVMHCRFRLHDPERGMPGGGVGQCQVSNGSHIDAHF
jgi:hypothetical protein